jgi:hypothetical protein
MKEYYAKAYIGRVINTGTDYYSSIVAWYINDIYYMKKFIEKLQYAIANYTIHNSVYLIKFEFGNHTKIFKYKAT